MTTKNQESKSDKLNGKLKQQECKIRDQDASIKVLSQRASNKKQGVNYTTNDSNSNLCNSFALESFYVLLLCIIFYNFCMLLKNHKTDQTRHRSDLT